MDAFIRWLDRRLYAQFGDNWDNKRFRGYLAARMPANGRVLDVGSGRGMHPEMDLRSLAEWVAGVDPDPRVFDNPHLDEARLLEADGTVPYADQSFDLIVSNNVLEHLADPGLFFSEVRRLLKPGGLFVAKTPNRHHYVALMARLTPHRFHQWVGRRRGRRPGDTFPTRYECNTPGSIRAHARRAGLAELDLRTWEGRPEYLRFHPLTYLLGFLYERLVSRLPGLWRFRAVIVCCLQRPRAAGRPGAAAPEAET